MTKKLTEQLEDKGWFATGELKVRGPIKVTLPMGYVFGQNGNPTQAQYEAALRESMGEHFGENKIVYSWENQ